MNYETIEKVLQVNYFISRLDMINKPLIIKGIYHNRNRFKIEKLEDGSVILIPIILIPKSELWLYKNTIALKKLEKGINQISKTDERHYLGDFTKYTNEIS